MASYMKCKSCLISLILALLSSCGGQNSPVASDGSTVKTVSGGVNTPATGLLTTKVSLKDSLAALYPNGQLPADRVAQAAKDLAQNPAVLHYTAPAPTSKLQGQSFGFASQSMALATDFQPVARFQNTTLFGAYFFSIYDDEIENTLTLNPDWILEGAAFWASLVASDGLSPVHRFRNLFNGSYLYTIYDTERADIVSHYAATYAYEGVAWHARQTQAIGWTPLYRFRNLTNGTYLFTADETEKYLIQIWFSDVFSLEGIAYYVRMDAPIDYTYKLPDTGVKATQCYGAGNNVMIDCTSLEATTLNPMQDGMTGRDVTALDAAEDGKLGFSYSAVLKTVGVEYDKTECVKDNLTGFMWEGKPTTGFRASTNSYTNLGSTGAADAGGYVNAVNSSNLCGHSDWRLPTLQELQSIVDYGVGEPDFGPRVDVVWFPNTASSAYWASSAPSTTAWAINFSIYQGSVFHSFNDNLLKVRLIRGAILPNAFSISPDGQEVADAKTGLIWRRCPEGSNYSAGGCTVANTFTHEAALMHAKAQADGSGLPWRLPNIKELASLVEDGATAFPVINTTVFPSTGGNFWSSTPYIGGYSPWAWYINFTTGDVTKDAGRSNPMLVRLVRAGR